MSSGDSTDDRLTLGLEEQRRTFDSLVEKWRRLEDQLAWAVRTTILLFAFFATTASLANPQPTEFSTVQFVTLGLSIVSLGVAFLWGVSSLAASEPVVGIGIRPPMEAYGAEVHRGLIDTYRPVIGSLEAETDRLGTHLTWILALQFVALVGFGITVALSAFRTTVIL